MLESIVTGYEWRRERSRRKKNTMGYPSVPAPFAFLFYENGTIGEVVCYITTQWSAATPPTPPLAHPSSGLGRIENIIHPRVDTNPASEP